MKKFKDWYKKRHNEVFIETNQWSPQPDAEGECAGCGQDEPLWFDPHDYERAYCKNCMEKIKMQDKPGSPAHYSSLPQRP